MMRLTTTCLALFLVVGCLSSTSSWTPATDGVYDELTEPDWAQFAEARRDLDLVRTQLARDAFARLARDNPENVVVGAWLQEAELQLTIEATRAELGEEFELEAVLEELRRSYRERADEVDSVTALILAARVETDHFAALALLNRALRQDENCAWAHYGRAHVLAQQEDWKGARRSLERALELERGHLWARRLEAWMFARTGNRDEAISALQEWLKRAKSDLRVQPQWLDEARLDLALLYTLDGSPERTRKLLTELDPRRDDPVRRLTLECAALEALGDIEGALEAAARAQEADPEAYLPRIQQALLFERRLDDPERAILVWEKVLALAEAGGDLPAIVQRARATVHLERLQQQLEG
jgi:tetratricopeptide (TPR) repeat protein